MKGFLRKIGIKDKDTVIFLIFLSAIFFVFICLWFLKPNLNNLIVTTFTISFAILCLIFWFKAGIVVFRALIAPSAVASIVIFLTKTYCELPINLQVADDSLKGLYSFGLLYSVFLLVFSLKKELFGDRKSNLKGDLESLKEIYGGKTPWIILTIYTAFIGLFLWQLLQILIPILSNLCVYS